MPAFLGLDIGTQSVKAVVWDGKKGGRLLSSGQKSLGMMPTTIPGRAEQQPHAWIEAVSEAVQSALATVDTKEIVAMGVSGQQHGLVALDAQLNVIRPAKLWCDVEADIEALAFSQHTGIQTPPGFTAPKLMWLRDNEPHNFERLRHVVLPHDYLNLWLTGELTMECGDASGTGLLDVSTRAWDVQRMAWIHPRLPELFPALIAAGDPAGTLRSDAAQALGLPAGIMVSAGSGDNMMSALGAGAVDAGHVVVSLGTSGTVFTSTADPIIDTSGAIAPFCDATGQWLPLLCVMNCTGPPEEVSGMFDLSREAITELAEAIPPGCGELHMLPYFAGERTPSWPRASAAIIGLRTGDLANPGLLYRAALEGSGFSLAAGVQELKSQGIPLEKVSVVGGGAQNGLWRRILANILQLPIEWPAVSETAAFGAALQAAACFYGADIAQFANENRPRSVQTIDPNAALCDAYHDALSRHQRSATQLFGDN